MNATTHPLQFIVTCDHLTERVQGSFPKINNPQSLSTQVSQLNHDYKTMKGIAEEIKTKGDDLVAQMCKVMTEGQPAAEYRWVGCDCMCVIFVRCNLSSSSIIINNPSPFIIHLPALSIIINRQHLQINYHHFTITKCNQS